jgi:hypothetical protein
MGPGLKPEYTTKNGSVQVSPDGYVKGLYIKPNARGAGEGIDLMRQVISDSDRTGIPLRLHVGEQRTDLPGFYEKLGFQDSGRDRIGRLFTRQPQEESPVAIQQIEGEAAKRVAANPYYPDALVSDLSAGRRTRLDPVEETALVNRRGTVQQRDGGGLPLMAQYAASERAAPGTFLFGRSGQGHGSRH